MEQGIENRREDFGTLSQPSTFWVGITLLIGIFSIGMDELVISPLLIDVSNTLHCSLNVTALSVSIYGLTSAIFAPIIAPLGDRIPRRGLMLVTFISFIVASVACALAPNMLVLLIARGLSGLAAGALVPTIYAYVGDTVSFQERGKIMGIVMAGWAVALVLGVPFGGWVGGLFGWRMTFASIAVFATISACFVFLRTDAPNNYISTVPAITGARRSMTHILKMSIQIPGLLLLIIVTFCDMFGFYGAYTFLGSFLRTNHNFNTAEAAGFIMIYGIGIALSPWTGSLADRIGQRKSLIASLFTLTFVLAALPHLAQHPMLLILDLFIWGIGQSTALTSLSTLLTEKSQEHRGQVMGLYSLATNLGVTLGSSLIGTIYTVYGYASVGLLCGLITLTGATVMLTSVQRVK